MRIHLERPVWDDRIHFRILEKVGTDWHSAVSYKLEKHERGAVSQPFMFFNPEDAQELVNQLYALGIQPSKLNGSVGQLEAVNRHLEDMRTLVFKNGT